MPKKKHLANVDFIAAEDTRVTLKLLNHFDIKKEMVSYYEHNKRQRGEIICQRILNGENCAIVTDAGMPAISVLLYQNICRLQKCWLCLLIKLQGQLFHVNKRGGQRYK